MLDEPRTIPVVVNGHTVWHSQAEYDQLWQGVDPDLFTILERTDLE